MLLSIGRCLASVLMAAVMPGAAAGQPVARTFGELRTLLKPGDYVLVVDRADRETWGKIVSISGAALTIATVITEDRGARIIVTTDERQFPHHDVRSVLRADRPGGPGEVVYPASWHIVDTLPYLTDVSIQTESSDSRRYRFARADAEAVHVFTPAGEAIALKKSQVVRVEHHGVSDGTADGLIVGALIGAGAGLGSMAIAYATACETCDAPEPGPMFLAAGTFGAGIGALTGWVVDKLHKGKTVVFPVVSPVLTAQRKGVALSWRF